MLLVGAIADAAIVGIIGHARFADVPLVIDEMFPRLDHRRVEIAAAGCHHGRDGCGGVVNGEAAVVDAAVLLLLGEQPLETFLDILGKRFLHIEVRSAHGGIERQRGDGRELAILPMTVRLLLGLEPLVAAGDGLADFLADRFVARRIGVQQRGGSYRAGSQEKMKFHGWSGLACLSKGAMITVTFVPSSGTRLGKGIQMVSSLLPSPG